MFQAIHRCVFPKNKQGRRWFHGTVILIQLCINILSIIGLLTWPASLPIPVHMLSVLIKTTVIDHRFSLIQNNSLQVWLLIGL